MKVRTTTYDLQLHHPFGLARSVSTTRTSVFCELSAGGVTGMGEAAPSKYYGETHDAVKKAVEEHADDIEESGVFYIRNIMEDVTAAGKATGSARAMLDMALYDLVGKMLDIPLYKLLGIQPRDELYTSYTIGIDTVDVMMKKVEEAKEFPILKIKMGRDVEQDIEVIREIRKAYSDKVIRVDANGGWTLEEAKKCIPVLADLGIEYVEQPLNMGELEKTAELTKWSPLPIFVDEDVHTSKDIPGLAGVCHGVNFKLMKCGGITEALRMIELANALDLQLMIGCMVESSLGIAAAAQIGSFFNYLDLDGNLLIDNDPFEGMKTINGNIKLSDAPGLGVSPKTDLFAS